MFRFSKIVVLTGVCAFFASGCGSSKYPEGFDAAGGNLWSGVVVYDRTQKPLFVVLGGKDSHVFPSGETARAVFVAEYPSGNTVWKNRDSLVKADEYFLVKKSDPAIAKQEWKVIH